MRGFRLRRLLLSAALCGVLLAPVWAQAAEFKSGSLAVSEAWTPPSDTDPKNAALQTMEIYFSVHNTGAAGDQIVGASTSIAHKLEIIGAGINGKVEPMGAIDLPSKRVTSLYPGGPCLRFSEMEGALTVGTRFTLHLEFADAGPIDIPVVVKQADDDEGE